MTLTDRQRNELEYHREHARENKDVLEKPFEWDVLKFPGKRWWNAYWKMFAFLASQNLRDKRVLVVGCGFGDDAIRLSRLGAQVYAFDLSPDSLKIARKLAEREGESVNFEQMPAETMTYEDNFFDAVVARDILHHVDIPETMKEIQRVCKDGALFVVDEIYSHSITDKIRHNTLVEKIIYPRMQRFIYGSRKPYITVDERKLSERDIAQISEPLGSMLFKKYFNFVVTRIVPDRYDWACKIDRVLMMVLKPVAGLLAGRVLFAGNIAK